jgi:hypothetical protein
LGVDRDATGVATEMLEAEAELRPRRGKGKALGPFEDDHGGFGEYVFEAEGLEIMEIFNAVEVRVIDLGRLRRSVDVHQCKSWAGDFVFGSGAESSDDTFR